jgi:RNA polymerase sigma-70 factor (ECF subfamily)
LSPEPAPDFSRIYEAYHARVLAYATQLVGPDGAEDLAQEVFIKVGRSLETLVDPSKLAPWIYAITINTVRDAVRARSARGEHPRGDRGRAGSGAENLLDELPDRGSRTAEEVAIRNEMVACYLDYVKRLPPDSYEVYVLTEFEQLSNEELARRLSLPLTTVKMRLHRARALLNEELRRNCRCYVNKRGELMGEPKGRRDPSAS